MDKNFNKYKNIQRCFFRCWLHLIVTKINHKSEKQNKKEYICRIRRLTLKSYQEKIAIFKSYNHIIYPSDQFISNQQALQRNFSSDSMDIDHRNPCRQRIHLPILKSSLSSSKFNNNYFACSNHTKSEKNILNNAIQTQTTIIQSGSKISPKCISIKNSEPENLKKQGNYENFSFAEISKKLSAESKDLNHLLSGLQTLKTQLNLNNQITDNVLIENTELSEELKRKLGQLKELQNSYEELEKKYIRLLQISNEQSNCQVQILLQQSENSVYRQKNKQLSVLQCAERLKKRIQDLDISSIKGSKQNSLVKLSKLEMP